MMGLKDQLVDLATKLEAFVESAHETLPISREQTMEMSFQIAAVAEQYPIGSDVTFPVATAQVTAAFLRNLIKGLPDDEAG